MEQWPTTKIMYSRVNHYNVRRRKRKLFQDRVAAVADVSI